MVSPSVLRHCMQLVSLLLHPVCMPLYVMWLLLGLRPSLMAYDALPVSEYFWALILLTYALLPAGFIYISYTLGWLSTLRMLRKERRIVLPMLASWYAISTYVLSLSVLLPSAVVSMLWIATVLLYVLWGLNFFLKISVHVASTSAVTGYFTALGVEQADLYILGIAILGLCCTCLVIGSRLYLKAHNRLEVYTATCVGFFVSSYCYGLLKFSGLF